MKTIINIDTPLNFKSALEYFSRSDKEIVDLCKENVYQRVLVIKDKPLLAIVKSVGTVLKPALDVYVPGCRSARLLSEVEQRIKRIFSLNQDIRQYYREISGDEVLSKLSKGHYGFKPPVTPSIYEALIWAITGQQLNLSFIYSLKARLVMKYGPKFRYNGRRYYGFPSPQELSSISPDELRDMQFSRRKAEYIIGLTRSVLKGDINLKGLERMKEEDALDRLMKIKGVGRWTAEYVLLRGMGHWGVIPADDIGIRNAVTHFYKYKKQVSGREVRKRAKAWGEYKGCAAFYLLLAYHQYKNKNASQLKR
jgi:DNA-3-methyladenine glycosylase II